MVRLRSIKGIYLQKAERTSVVSERGGIYCPAIESESGPIYIKFPPSVHAAVNYFVQRFHRHHLLALCCARVNAWKAPRNMRLLFGAVHFNPFQGAASTPSGRVGGARHMARLGAGSHSPKNTRAPACVSRRKPEFVCVSLQQQAFIAAQRET
jgi:hypothetical protein